MKGAVDPTVAKIAKPAQAVGPDDVLTFPIGTQIRVVRILALGTRRGPAPEAGNEQLTAIPAARITGGAAAEGGGDSDDSG